MTDQRDIQIQHHERTIQIVQLLDKHGGNPNLAEYATGKTCLMMVSTRGMIVLVNQLLNLKIGADPNLFTKDGLNTALSEAVTTVLDCPKPLREQQNPPMVNFQDVIGVLVKVSSPGVLNHTKALILDRQRTLQASLGVAQTISDFEALNLGIKKAADVLYLVEKGIERAADATSKEIFDAIIDGNPESIVLDRLDRPVAKEIAQFLIGGFGDEVYANREI